MAMGSRLKQEDIRIEEKVRLQCTRLRVRVIDDVIAGIVDGDDDFESLGARSGDLSWNTVSTL